MAGYSYTPHPGLTKLDQNESPFDLPVLFKKRILKRLLALSWNRYPTPFADTVAEALAKKYRWSKDGIVVATGSNVLIQALMAAASLKGSALVLDPGFPLYEIEAGLFENRVIRVPLGPAFAFPKEELKASIAASPPGLILIANPNAPTGTLFALKDIYEIAEQASCLVVVDEAYFEFSGVTAMDGLNRYPNLVVVRTLSKAFGMAGVRLGYLLGTPALAREIKKVILPFSVSSLQIEIALAMLNNSKWVQGSTRAILKERQRLEKEMRQIRGLEVVPTAANFIAFRGPRDRVTFGNFLAAGVVIRDISRPGPLEGMLRVTVGTPQEDNLFLKVLKNLISA